jgi:CheY-like chemotaxis protein/HPt (histidine-containing phosphotransfer) domain-containing protein
MEMDEIQGRRVLVVDDDVIMRDVLALMLDAGGYDVWLAESGEAALQEIADGAAGIDIVLTDMHMPGLQGAELARRLRAAAGPRTLLIGMSGSEPETEEMREFRAFLEKPFTVEAFAEAVERALAEDEATQTATGKLRKSTAVLDEDIFTKLQAMMPAAQLRELYRITLEDVRRRVEQMCAAKDRGDWMECRAEAHSIKGGCGMVGANELSALAADVERGAETGTMEFADFDAACSRLQGMLDSRIG